MSSPDWKMAVAKDGQTEVRVRIADDGTTSIRLSSGPVSIVAALSAGDTAFLLAKSADLNAGDAHP